MGLIEFPTSAMRGQMKSSSIRNRDRREKVRFDRGVLGMSAGMVCVGRGPSAKRSGQGRPRTRGAEGDRCGNLEDVKERWISRRGRAAFMSGESGERLRLRALPDWGDAKPGWANI